MLTDRNIDSVSYSLLNLKISAAYEINEIAKIQDLAVAVQDELNDYIKLCSTSIGDDAFISYQKTFWEKFNRSIWFHYLEHFSDYKDSLITLIKNLEIIKTKYEHLITSSMGSDLFLKHDAYYKKLKNEIEKAKGLAKNLNTSEIDKLYKKYKEFDKKIGFKKSNKMPNKRLNLPKSVLDNIYRIQDKELYVVYRKMKNAVKNIITPVFDHLMDYQINLNLIEEMTQKINFFIQRVQAAKDLDNLNAIFSDIKSWMFSREGEIRHLLDGVDIFNDTLKKLQSDVNDFEMIFDKLRTSTLADLKERKLELAGNEFDDSGHYNMIYDIVVMIESKDYSKLQEIENAYENNLYNLQEIRNLGIYLRYLNLLNKHKIDLFLLEDLKLVNQISSKEEPEDKRQQDYQFMHDVKFPYIMELSMSIRKLQDVVQAKERSFTHSSPDHSPNSSPGNTFRSSLQNYALTFLKKSPTHSGSELKNSNDEEKECHDEVKPK